MRHFGARFFLVASSSRRKIISLCKCQATSALALCYPSDIREIAAATVAAVNDVVKTTPAAVPRPASFAPEIV